ncbi:MAG: hypothetical protein WDM85_08480 [Caulobacteraceae bacterium]
MANGFDRRGAVVGVILLIILMLVGAAVLIPFNNPVTIKIDIPPAASNR